MVDVAAVGCFASLAESTRQRAVRVAFFDRAVDDALPWASTSTSTSIYGGTVLGVDPYLGVGSITVSYTHLTLPTIYSV